MTVNSRFVLLRELSRGLLTVTGTLLPSTELEHKPLLANDGA